MRVYLSGPIAGKNNYMKHFAAAENDVKRGGHEVINPAKNARVMPRTTTHKEYMKVSLAQLDCCDAIYMLNGWEGSSGAREEFCYAVDKRIPIFFEEEK